MAHILKLACPRLGEGFKRHIYSRSIITEVFFFLEQSMLQNKKYNAILSLTFEGE